MWFLLLVPSRRREESWSVEPSFTHTAGQGGKGDTGVLHFNYEQAV